MTKTANKGFSFVLIVRKEDMTLPWSHIRAKLRKTFDFQLDGLRFKIEAVNMNKEGAKNEFKIEVHS